MHFGVVCAIFCIKNKNENSITEKVMESHDIGQPILSHYFQQTSTDTSNIVTVTDNVYIAMCLDLWHYSIILFFSCNSSRTTNCYVQSRRTTPSCIDTGCNWISSMLVLAFMWDLISERKILPALLLIPLQSFCPKS